MVFCIRLNSFFSIHAILWISLTLPLTAKAQEVTGPHPSYDLMDILPVGFEDGIGGMDFLPDGKLAVCTWGGIQKKQGKVYILSGVSGAQASTVTYTEITKDLNEPLGLKVIGQDIFFMQKQGLFKLTSAPNGTYTLSTVYTGYFYEPAQYHQFATGLEYKDGSFYFMATSSHAPKLESEERGALIRIDPVAKTHEVIANGMREPNSLITGPEGELFTTDNQGEWRPANMLIHLKKGRFFGMHGPTAPVAAGRPVSPPAIWYPHGETAQSPTQPVFVKDGIFKGQMLVGDVNLGGLKRLFLEKVKGEFQGAVFRFSGTEGFTCAWNRLVFGPDGALYLGGIGGNSALGNPGGWGWNSKTFGLMKMKPNGKTVFEMLAVRSSPTGFEIEFTKPLGNAAIQTSNFTARKWWYQPTAAYGGPKIGEVAVTVSAARISADRTKINLDLAGFEPLKVYGLKINGITSQTGEAPRSNEAWYTVLNVGSADVTIGIASSRTVPNLPCLLPIKNGQGRFILDLTEYDTNRDWRVIGLDGSGKISGRFDGRKSLLLPAIEGSGIFHLLVRDDSGNWIPRATLYP